jgi:putative integral membrane protein (TIGR02587 family)
MKQLCAGVTRQGKSAIAKCAPLGEGTFPPKQNWAFMTSADVVYARGLSRAFVGALLFAFPLMMTMEMWWLGFYMDRWRLVIFMLVNLCVLVGLSHFAGFEPSSRWADAVMDAFAAFAIGLIASILLLTVFAVIDWHMPLREIAGKAALQTIPASIGAVLARKQLGSDDSDTAPERKEAGYSGQLFLMAAGALFLAFTVAPTEEMELIAYKMTGWHALVLIFASLILLHILVYATEFAGQKSPPEGAGLIVTVLQYSVAGYGIALLISSYVLWTFGRMDGVSIFEIAQMVAVLGFPASLGAALARLII